MSDDPAMTDPIDDPDEFEYYRWPEKPTAPIGMSTFQSHWRNKQGSRAW